MSLHDDLARRDFTVNAFALDPRSGEVIDPFGGLADLDRRLLRATTPRELHGRSAARAAPPPPAAPPARLRRRSRDPPPRPPSPRPASPRWPPSGCATSSRCSSPTPRPIAASPCWWRSTSIPASGWARPASRVQPAGAIAELEALPERDPEMRRDRHRGRRPGRRRRPPASPRRSLHLPPKAGAAERLERFRDAGYITRQEAARSRSSSAGRSCRRAISAGAASSTAPVRSGPRPSPRWARAPPARRPGALARAPPAAAGSRPPGG